MKLININYKCVKQLNVNYQCGTQKEKAISERPKDKSTKRVKNW